MTFTLFVGLCVVLSLLSLGWGIFKNEPGFVIAGFFSGFVLFCLGMAYDCTNVHEEYKEFKDFSITRSEFRAYVDHPKMPNPLIISNAETLSKLSEYKTLKATKVVSYWHQEFGTTWTLEK